MTPLRLNLFLFILTAAAFAWIGFAHARREKSVRDYFHHADLFKNAVSLTASNISLGTGLVYLVSGAQQNGLLMLLPVLAVGVGYWLLAAFIEHASSVAARTGKNYLGGVDEEISKATGERSLFAKAVSLSLIVVFVLLLEFEIFASAKVISPLLFASPTVHVQVALSVGVFCITVLYAVLGGVSATFGVDVIQVPLICLFLPALVVTAIPDWSHPAELARRLQASVKLEHSVLIAVAIATINALSTQFYSLLNWGALSNVEIGKQKTLLRWVGVATTGVLAIFVLVGLLHSGGNASQTWQDIVGRFSLVGTSTSPRAFLLSALVMLGMASVLLTTTDAVVVNCILFWHDNLSGADSKADESDPGALHRIRRAGAITFGACFAILCAINFLQPDPFYLLLSMAGGVVVFAPMIVTVGLLSKRPGGLRMFSRRVVGVFVGLFVAAGVADVVLLSRGSRLVPYIGLAAFLAASLLCLVLWKIGSSVVDERGSRGGGDP